MKSTLFLVGAIIACLRIAPAAPLEWHFEFDANGVPDKLVWQAGADYSYDLWVSADLAAWSHATAFPQTGSGGPMEYDFTPGARWFFKLVSEPNGLVLIPAGSFEMGDQSDPSVGFSWELPVHSVYVSGFHMGRHEVTKALWDEVRAWGANHGYTDLPAGGGKAANHPVQDINWYAMVKWCNARSEKEGLSPCYTVSGAVYRTGNSDAVDCDWNTDGYRLPTEAEWEKAARGGLTGKNFPWGDMINHSNANYNANGSAYTYDTSPYTSYTDHPDWDEGGYPYTSPVGTFAPNGYGLYDMSGNVWEWCWDRRGGSNNYPSSAVTDPRGDASGTVRVDRGGGWYDNARLTRCAYRGWTGPVNDRNDLGFRTARSQ